MEEKVQLPVKEFQKLYGIKLRLETYFKYLEENDGALKWMAPGFLEDAKTYIEEYNKITNEKV